MNKNERNIEKTISDYVLKLIYAALADIQIQTDTDKYNKYIWQSYDNICKTKSERAVGLKAIVLLADSVKQFLAFIFVTIIEELQNIDIDDTDTRDIIMQKAFDANAICYTSALFALTNTYSKQFGPLLQEAVDSNRWFHGQLVAYFPRYRSRQIILGRIATDIDMLLKTMSLLLSRFLWYYKICISEQLFLAMLFQQGISAELLDIMQSNLRIKVKTQTKNKVRQTKVVTVVASPIVGIDNNDDHDMNENEALLNELELNDDNI